MQQVSKKHRFGSTVNIKRTESKPLCKVGGGAGGVLIPNVDRRILISLSIYFSTTITVLLRKIKYRLCFHLGF